MADIAVTVLDENTEATPRSCVKKLNLLQSIAVTKAICDQIHREVAPLSTDGEVERYITDLTKLAERKCVRMLSLISDHINRLPVASGQQRAEKAAAQEAYNGIKELDPKLFIQEVLNSLKHAPKEGENRVTPVAQSLALHLGFVLQGFCDEWLPFGLLGVLTNTIAGCVSIINESLVLRTSRESIEEALRTETAVDASETSGGTASGTNRDDTDSLDALARLTTSPLAVTEKRRTGDDLQEDSQPKEEPLLSDVPTASAAPAPLPFNLHEDTPRPNNSDRAPATADLTTPAAAVITPTPTTKVASSSAKPKHNLAAYGFLLASAIAGVAGGVYLARRPNDNAITEPSDNYIQAEPLVPTYTNQELPAPSPVPPIPETPRTTTTVSTSSNFLTVTGGSSLETGVRNALMARSIRRALARCVNDTTIDPRYLAVGLTAHITTQLRTAGWNAGNDPQHRGIRLTFTDNGRCNDFKAVRWQGVDAEQHNTVPPTLSITPINPANNRPFHPTENNPMLNIARNRQRYHHDMFLQQ